MTSPHPWPLVIAGLSAFCWAAAIAAGQIVLKLLGVWP